MKLNRWCFLGIALFLISAAGGAAHSAIWDTDSRIIRKVPTTHKVVAMTFDDGPHYRTTPEILAVLKEKQVKATFFTLGSNAEKHPELLAKVQADGHEIGTHAYSHKLLTRMKLTECEQELDKAEQILGTIGIKPVLFRPPGGAWNDGVIKAARDRGYDVILWSIDTRDWARPSVDHVVQEVFKNIKPGSIILFHDGEDSLPTPQAIRIIIDGLRLQGYQMVTVGELLQYYEVRQ